MPADLQGLQTLGHLQHQLQLLVLSLGIPALGQILGDLQPHLFIWMFGSHSTKGREALGCRSIGAW
jgi:hypothetical protein